MKRAPAAALFLAALFACGSAAAEERSELLDENEDGRKETTMYFDGKTKVRAEVDMNGDGKADRWVKFKNEKRFAAENDRDHDGKIDGWDFYDAQGILTRSARDSNADGKPDSFKLMLKGREIILREDDKNADGKIDKRRLTQWALIKRGPGDPGTLGYKTLWREEDNDFDGIIDVYKERGNAEAGKEKIGQAMDTNLTPVPDPEPKPAAGSAEDAKLSQEKRHVDRMNKRFGYSAIDWEDGKDD